MSSSIPAEGDQGLQRRPIAARKAPWANSAARALVDAGLTPNQVSVASSVFALIGGGLFIDASFASAAAGKGLPGTATGAAALLVGAACCIQLRLLCNMLDGMMAVEYNKKSATGELFNEIPDRISDTLFLAAAGYVAGGSLAGLSVALGWTAAALGMLTAYIRAFGARYMREQDYSGPMAKPHRMFALTIGAMLTALQIYFGFGESIMPVCLAVICAGAAYTAIRRTKTLASTMQAIEDEAKC